MAKSTLRAAVSVLLVASIVPASAMAGDKKKDKDKGKDRHEKRRDVMEQVLRTLAEAATANPSSSGGRAPVTVGSASITRVWVDHNQWVGGVQGMIIHASVSVNGRRGIPVRLTAYFHYGDGRVLKDFNGTYAAADGQVSVGSSPESPLFDRTSFNDWELFLPYDELHMARGNYDLMFNLWVTDANTGAALTSLGNQHFTYWKN